MTASKVDDTTRLALEVHEWIQTDGKAAAAVGTLDLTALARHLLSRGYRMPVSEKRCTLIAYDQMYGRFSAQFEDRVLCNEYVLGTFPGRSVPEVIAALSDYHPGETGWVVARYGVPA